MYLGKMAMSIADVSRPPAIPAEDIAAETLFKKIAWRLMPFLSIGFLIAQIDRVNVSFAKIEMLDDLKFSETTYGLGAGIFFVGYCIFEVPANLILRRVGARLWLGGIMFVWGLVSAATLFITTPMSFYAIRFLLGVAEAGFFPGSLYFMTFWFTSRQRGRMTAILMTAIAVSGLIVGPVSGAVLHGLGGVFGLKGWQWIFLIEAIPALVLGVVWWRSLPSTPEEARWLTVEEKSQVTRRLHQDGLSAPHGGQSAAMSAVLTSLPVWGLALIYTCFGVAFYGTVFWLPTIVKGTGINDPLTIGLLTAIPWGVSVVGMVTVAAYTDKKQNSRRVLIFLSLLSAAGFSLLLASHDTAVSLLALTIAMFGIMAALPVFWNFPTRLFGGGAAAVTIAVITSLGNFAGFFSPYIVGWAKDTFGTLDFAMYVFIGSMLLAIPLLLALPRRVDPPKAG